MTVRRHLIPFLIVTVECTQLRHVHMFPTGWRCPTAAVQTPSQKATGQELMTPTMWVSGERCCLGRRSLLSLKAERNFATGTTQLHSVWSYLTACSCSPPHSSSLYHEVKHSWSPGLESEHELIVNHGVLKCVWSAASSTDTLTSWSCTSCSSVCAAGSRSSRCLWTKWAFSSVTQPQTETTPPTRWVKNLQCCSFSRESTGCSSAGSDTSQYNNL